MRLKPRSIRTRVTLWYVSVLGVSLFIYSIGVATLFLWQLQKQLGTHAIEDIETIEGLLYFTPAGQLKLHDDYHNHPASKLVQERLVEVWSGDGQILFKNDRLGDRSLGGPPFRGEGVGGYSERHIHLKDGTPITLVSRHHVLDGRPLLIRLGYSEEPIWERLEHLFFAMLIGLPVIMGLAGLALHLLLDRVLSPIGEMVQRAERISLDRLNTRLPVENDDELGHLARVFNEMLGRLEQSFEQLRRFTADASHELRTPLAALRSVGEVGIQKDGSREDYRDIIGNMLEETNRLTRLVESLLTLSRADAGQIQLRTTRFPIMGLLRESAELLEVLADEKEQRMILQGDERASVTGDALFLRQAFVNILHNAIKYSPAGGLILVSVELDRHGSVTASIKDSGPGIAPEYREKVFDRFYRIDPGRARDSGGDGLGLAIVKWVVQAHGGEIHLGSAANGGSVVSIQLPSV